MGIRSADERTQTAYLPSLRVISHVLQGFAGTCKVPNLSRFLFFDLLRVAPYCGPGGVRGGWAVSLRSPCKCD